MFFPYSISRCSTRSHISGNRGYDSNRACYHYCFWFSTSVLFDLYSVQNLKASPALAAIFIHSVANSNASHWISQRCTVTLSGNQHWFPSLLALRSIIGPS